MASRKRKFKPGELVRLTVPTIMRGKVGLCKVVAWWGGDCIQLFPLDRDDDEWWEEISAMVWEVRKVRKK
jgi:hypothetical protein